MPVVAVATRPRLAGSPAAAATVPAGPWTWVGSSSPAAAASGAIAAAASAPSLPSLPAALPSLLRSDGSGSNA